MSTAFGLRAAYADNYTGGLIRVSYDRELNVKEALDEGGGTIVVADDDEQLISALDAYPALKRSDAPDDAEPTAGRYDDATVASLRNDLKVAGLSTSGNRDELVARLETHNAAVASGDAETAANPDNQEG